MKFLKTLFAFYINSSVHVALAVVSFTLVSFLQEGREFNRDLIAFIFFASITGYNFVKYSGIAKLHHLSLTRNLRWIQIFSFFCFLGLVYFTLQLQLRTIIATGILGLFTLLYALPVFSKKRNLRSLPGLKIFVIAAVWAGSTVILPVIEAEKLMGMHLILDMIQRFMLVVVLTLPFEIRDVRFDESDLDTIPQKIGVRKTKTFGTVLLILIFFIELFQKDFQNIDFLTLTLILIILGIMLWKSRTLQHRYYASFWVEAVPIFYFLLLFLGKVVY
ncbi:hypothetical protein C7S20_02270 [Christiangramia fulva]|uniref:Prenyltransferase n=1 Tax=Christiangramia fulva TaxID=2126553 RepID=A0A2R3ZAK5_9FLAO|nr:hypothetical protein [Christiangramia fulva]AVR47297.1 hypothetical protein C7S20_02270 [Christiangramia fulva]